jgi:hypothetical protein
VTHDPEPPEIPLAELTKFGIEPRDEGFHAFDPDVPWWNESWFWDWFDAGGRVAGHCRIGLHPTQKRAWLWLFLYRDGEWIALEEPRLPLGDWQTPRLAYRGWGLEFAYDPIDPLRRGHLRVSGFGRVTSGPRTGKILPMGVDLEFAALGAAHTTGRNAVAGHSSDTFDACRFEQPVRWRGELRMGDDRVPFQGRGERDHSWGPRPWNMDWMFAIGNGDDMRFQVTEVHIPGAPRIGGGYLSRETTGSVADVEFDVAIHEDRVLDPFSGGFRFRSEAGDEIRVRLEVISAAEIDITHVFEPPQRSFYRRALLRLHVDGVAKPLVGWLECNRRAQGAPTDEKD